MDLECLCKPGNEDAGEVTRVERAVARKIGWDPQQVHNFMDLWASTAAALKRDDRIELEGPSVPPKPVCRCSECNGALGHKMDCSQGRR